MSKFKIIKFSSFSLNRILFLFFITNCTLLIPSSRDCYSQWVIQNSGTPNHLYDVYFINTQTGWACGNNGTIIKTTNGGSNWFGQTSGTAFPLFSIHFVNSYIGYAVTRVDGYFQKTFDGGSNWFTVFFSPKSFESIYFIDSLTGWAAGTSGGGWVFRTTNGGISWDSVYITTGASYHVFFWDAQIGLVSVGSDIFKSTDGGVSWSFQFSTIGTGVIKEFSFVNSNTGWIFTDGYRVYKTTNGGNNWILQANLMGPFNGHSICFSSINTGWVSGDSGFMSRTSDGGETWYLQNTNTTSFLNSVFFLTDSIGYSVGGGGRIIFTNTSGSIVPVVNINTNMPGNFELFQNYPNPFNPATKIRFSIPPLEGGRGRITHLIIYDIVGREAAILVNESLLPGTYEVKFDGTNYPSGVYFYTLILDVYRETKKMLLTK